MTEYLILGKTGTDIWTEAEKRVTAPSAKAAIRVYLNGDGQGGEFVAVPARSWQPVKVQVETALKFS